MMKLEDIKTGAVLWNHWTYSIMGRDTGDASDYYIVTEVGNIEEGNGETGQRLTCHIKSLKDRQEKKINFNEAEIKRGWLRFATKQELQMKMFEEKTSAEKKILEHQHNIAKLELQNSSLQENYKEFIAHAF